MPKTSKTEIDDYTILANTLIDDTLDPPQKLAELTRFLKTQAPQTQLPPTQRSWTALTFTGFQPADSTSSLFRKWSGLFCCTRSDGIVFNIPITTVQNDGPVRIGDDLIDLFEQLESRRECNCSTVTVEGKTAPQPCHIHIE